MSGHKSQSLIIGLDVGGSKAHVRVVDAAGSIVADVVIDNTGWAMRADEERAQTLLDYATRAISGQETSIAAVVAGVHGNDSAEQQRILTAPLATRFDRVRIVNDSSLLVPAKGLSTGTGLTAGTGSSATATRHDGEEITVGGWGWVLGDEGGGVGLVRDAARQVLAAYDAGEDDLLAPALLDALEIGHPHALTHRLATGEPRDWSAHAHVVFDAWRAGSSRAYRIVEAHGEAMAEMIRQLERRGGQVNDVVCAGGVITNHEPLFTAFIASMRRRFGERSTVTLLDVPPVAGAVRLARTLAGLPAEPANQGAVS